MHPSARHRETAENEHAEFRRELVGGRLRWLFSLMAAVSAAASMWTLADPQLETWFPFHAAGRVLQWLAGLGTVLWGLIAAVNWRNWLRSQRSAS